MKVSVVIPCYNGEEYIGQTLGSLFDQTRSADEIIVVDDGSTDRSTEIALSFGESVTVLSKGGGGAAMARNYGADHASGDAIMFLDADDLLAPDVLEHLLDELKKNPEGVVACPWYRLEKIGDKWVKRPPSCAPLGKDQDHLSGWLTGWYHLPCSLLWSRTAYRNRGGWDPRAYVNDDGDLMMRALADGIKLQITDKGSSFYRRMPEEQLTESLSGARFTRKGREAQIYVIHKIAQMLEDRNKLKDYRKPITQAFEQYRDLCVDQYPDLSEHCNELIDQFGGPRHVQIARKFGRSGQRVVHTCRRTVGLMKKRVLTIISGDRNRSDKVQDRENYEEVCYGLNTFKKIKKAGKKGDLKKPSNPEVSVILPLSEDRDAFNSSLKSVLDQEFENFEVIVVGTEYSAISISDIEMYDDTRLRLVTANNNGKAAELYNRGLKEVKGDFIAFIKPGDEWDPAKLARQYEYFKNASDKVGLVYTGSEFVDHQGKMTKCLPEKKGDVYKKLLHGNIIGCCSTVMLRRTVIPGIGFLDPRLTGLENHDYWLRLSRFYIFDFIEDVVVRCQIGNIESVSEKMEKSQLFLDKYHRELKQTNTDKVSDFAG